MVNRQVVAGLVGVVALVCASMVRAEDKAAKPPAAKAAPAPAAANAAGKVTLVAPAELKWVDPPNAPPGVKVAAVEGDMAKGPNRAFHKFAAGFKAPLHTHSSDHHVVVVSGTIALAVEGQAEKKLPAGSYFEMIGKQKHTTKCEAGADCILFVDVAGPWDVVLVEKPAPKK